MNLIKRPRLTALVLILATLITAAWLLPLEQIVLDLQAWVDQHPRWSMLAVLGLLVVGILMMLPASLMMMLSGFLFGLGKGFLVFWAATLVASTAAFLIGRTLGRPWVSRRIAQQPKFQAIDRAVRRKGFFVVFLTRLILLLPFPALNYSHGLTDVRLRDYMAGTMLGMVPPILLFVYLGTLASSVADIVNGRVALEGGQVALAVAGAIAAILVAVVIVVAARKALRAELGQAARDL